MQAAREQQEQQQEQQQQEQQQQERQTTKRMRTSMNAIADEWVCPITQELPHDPVTAEDGNIYEREAITDWLKRQQRSPINGNLMGTRLLPTAQVRNTIEHLVRSGAIDGDRAKA